MRATVWMRDGQLQCCGDPFRVGVEVRWTASPPDEKRLAELLGPELAKTVTDVEEHHGGEHLRPVTGIVRSIRAVCVDYAPRADAAPNMFFPVPGTTAVTEVRSADGWFDGGGSKFAGYLVELE